MKSLHLLLLPSFWIMASALMVRSNDDINPKSLLSDCSTAINAIPGHAVKIHGTPQEDQTAVTSSNNARLWEAPAWISNGACNILVRSVDPEMNQNTPVSLRQFFWSEVKARAWMLYREDVSRGLMGYDIATMSGMPDHHMYSLMIEWADGKPYNPPRNTTTLTWTHYVV